ncbi:hypothetical protein [Pseudonocardia sp. WMMC193]|uniref:hypothetical protein n=1 Tax=Pseudonocardia sp. WMMC193 TaxID=2911965 RepID=UPI001F395A0D|nr:hypothetical protein [Pseudonocardia sp. WMMC193]MCF7547345.1 hypothetical protein [Pseudonocardia sp. WMMC193]
MQFTAPVMAPLTDRSTAGVAFAESARLVSDFARYLVPGAAAAPPGVLVGDALRLLELAQRTLQRAVEVELAAGRSWELVAAELCDRPAASPRSGPAAGSSVGSSEAGVRALVVAADPAAEVLAQAEQLDEWSCRHREEDELDDGACPVSSALERMDPPAELAHLERLEGWLLHSEEFSAQQRRQALHRLRARRQHLELLSGA